ncbi:MAG TPA: MFS transporter [Candidatus Limnocylindria bacterium]|nr:MFS transporter [Candidatus Limnocylindria bacterium]
MTPARGGAWTGGRRLLTAGLVFTVTAVAFEGLAVPTALPATLDELRGLHLYGWAFSGFWLSNLVGITVAGAEADRRGPFPPFVAAVLAFSAGLLIAGLAPSMEWVVAGRVVQGLGAGAISSLIYVAIARGYDPAAQPRMIAVISSAWVVPGLVGPALAGWISEELSWRWTFLGLAPLVPLAAAAVAVPLVRLPRPPARASSADGTGSTSGWRPARDAVLLAVAAGALLSAASFGEPPARIGLATAGALLIYGPLRRLLPAGSLTARHGRGAAIMALALLSAAFFGVEAFIPLAVASVRNAGTVAGGLALTAAAVTWAAGSWLQARLAARRSRSSVTTAGLVLVTAGIGIVALVPVSPFHPVIVAGAGWAVAGFGMGLAYSTTILAVLEGAPAGAEGQASASVQLAHTLGIALGTGVAGGAVTAGAVALGMAPGIFVADLVMLLVAGAAVIAARRMSRTPPERTGTLPETVGVAGATRGPSL